MAESFLPETIVPDCAECESLELLRELSNFLEDFRLKAPAVVNVSAGRYCQFERRLRTHLRRKARPAGMAEQSCAAVLQVKRHLPG